MIPELHRLPALYVLPAPENRGLDGLRGRHLGDDVDAALRADVREEQGGAALGELEGAFVATLVLRLDRRTVGELEVVRKVVR